MGNISKYSMACKTDKLYNRFAESEIGTIRKDPRGRTRVALIYPNRYYVGMSNLGFQTVYLLLNKIENVVCERGFLPENQAGDTRPSTNRPTTIESERPISDFDIIAFSVSFENDYPNLLTILEKSQLPLLSRDRGTSHPLVIAGGVACLLNPEPIAPFIDCFLIGEAEGLLSQFFTVLYETGLAKGFKTDKEKESCLKTVAQNVSGAYVPAFYKAVYNIDRTLCSFEPVCDVPSKIERVYVKDLSHVPTCSSVITPNTTFGLTFLIEVARGCPHGCRFCSTGYIYRPPRFRPVLLLEKCLEQGSLLTNRIGLVGTAVSDLPEIVRLCEYGNQKGNIMSFSSFRADSFTPELLSALRQSKVKTAAIAPDAGSERMRKVINKGIVEEDILNAAEILIENGILNLKLYFMIGLPTETMDDVEAIAKLCQQIKKVFLKKSRARKQIGKITVSLNSFVPKPFTPFQWVAMEKTRALKGKVKKIKDALKRVANVRVVADSQRWAHIQALFARGDRKVAQFLSLAHNNGGNWARTFKESPLDSDFYIHRERPLDELLPWDFIDHGLKKSFLAREYKKAVQEKTSPPCPMEACDICGVCKKDASPKEQVGDKNQSSLQSA